MDTQAQATDCIFCRIVAGTNDASIVYRDDVVTAFMDISPLVDGHTLVIPNAHAKDLEGVSEQSGAAMFNVGRRIALAMLGSELVCEGVNYFLAHGAVAGQTVFHCHLHVIPRHAGDGFGIHVEGLKRRRAQRDALDGRAATIAAALDSIA